MDVVGTASLSMASLHALFGQAMPAGARARGEAGPTMPALALEAASMAGSEALVAAMLNGMATPSATSLARSIASLSILDPAVELARLSR
jgi:hypothetical protein